MKIIQSPEMMTSWSNRCIAAGHSIALVPTMGYFHEGHLRLMRSAAAHADQLVVSLFVNPIQFGPNEDLGCYPRDPDRDAAFAEKENVDVLFMPSSADMYHSRAQTRITVDELSSELCGASRPGHFTGVATVVAKLFNIVKPHVAVFGSKDFQQLAVIRRMVEDLNYDVRIVGHPIVREPDGLAMSSRNVYLDKKERVSALCLSKAIALARNKVEQGETDAARLAALIESFVSVYDKVKIDYVKIVDQRSLAAQERITEDSVLALAVFIGKTRLIDNGLLFGPEQEQHTE